jgi:hypothetical protein
MRLSLRRRSSLDVRHGLACFLILLVTCDQASASARSRRRAKAACQRAVVEHHPLLDREAMARLPHSWPVGVSIVDRIHWIPDPSERTPRTLVTIHPVPRGTHGSLVNLNALSLDDPLPQRFLVGDGTMRRVLVGIDRSPGSPLSRWLERTRYQIEHFRTADQPLPEAVLQALLQHCAGNMGPVRSDRGDGQGALPWDERIPRLDYSIPDLQHTASDHRPAALGLEHPVVPLEEYLKRCEGYCLQQSFFAALVLRLFGVRSRVVNGATAYFEPGGPTFDGGLMRQPGHAWVELENDRVLDPLAGVVDTATVWRDVRPANYPTRVFTRKWAFLPQYRTWTQGQWVDTWRFPYVRYFAVDLDGRTPNARQ